MTEILVVVSAVIAALGLYVFIRHVVLGDTPVESVTHCPLCGLELETWVEQGAFSQGYTVDRQWRNACPVKRQRTDPNWMNHMGTWRGINERAAFDPKTGRPQS